MCQGKYLPIARTFRVLAQSGLNLTPDNPFGLPSSSLYGPRGSDTISVSSGMFQGILPRIPNLEVGYIYSFGPNVRSGRGTVDYLLPVSLGNDSVVFGEAHAEFQDFWKTAPGGANNRTDISIGGGYRKMITSDTLVGVNGFYDTSKLFGTWYSSGGVGLEMAALTPGSGAIDLNLNYYGNIFSSEGIINAFRNKGGSYDIEAGYSQPLFNQALDLRMKFAGYQFDVGGAVYGWRGGADLTTRNGVFTVRYEHGQDRLNGSYDTFGGFVNVGFDLANILKGESPFEMPEPIFKSPRNLRRLLTYKVRRNWHQCTSAVISAAGGAAITRTVPSPYTFGPMPAPNYCDVAIVFIEGTVPASQLDGVTRINISVTITNNTSSAQTFGIMSHPSDTVFSAGSPTIPAGATGTWSYDLANPGDVDAINEDIRYFSFQPGACGSETITIGETVVLFYR